MINIVVDSAKQEQPFSVDFAKNIDLVTAVPLRSKDMQLCDQSDELEQTVVRLDSSIKPYTVEPDTWCIKV